MQKEKSPTTNSSQIRIATLWDWDGCMIHEKSEPLCSVLDGVKKVMGGEKALIDSIKNYPFIESYFKSIKKSYDLESSLIDLLVDEIEPLMAHLSLGDKAKNTEKLAAEILKKDKVKGFFDEIKIIPLKQQEEIIYRIALHMSTCKTVITNNQPLLNHLKQKVDIIAKDFPESIITVIFVVFSIRQSSNLDVINFVKNLNGLASMQFSFFYQYAFRKIFANTPYLIKILPISLADRLGENLAIGESFFFRKDLLYKNYENIDYAISYLTSDQRGSKTFLLSHILTALTAAEEGEVVERVFALVIDNDPVEKHTENTIFQLCFDFFVKNPHIIPEKVTVELIVYGNDGLKIDCFFPFTGSGKVSQIIAKEKLLFEKLKRKINGQEEIKSRKKFDDDISLVLGKKSGSETIFPYKYTVKLAPIEFKEEKIRYCYDILNLWKLISKENEDFWNSVGGIHKEKVELPTFERKTAIASKVPIYDKPNIKIKGESWAKLRNTGANLKLEAKQDIYSFWFNSQSVYYFLNKVLNVKYIGFSSENEKILIYFENSFQCSQFQIKKNQFLLKGELCEYNRIYSFPFFFAIGISKAESEFILKLTKLLDNLNCQDPLELCDTYNQLATLQVSFQGKPMNIPKMQAILMDLLKDCYQYLEQLNITKLFYNIHDIVKTPQPASFEF